MSLFHSLGQLLSRNPHTNKASSRRRKRTLHGKRGLRFELLEERSMLANTDLAGGNQPHENLQSYVALNYVIATEGIFPSQNLGSTPYLGAVDIFAGNFAPVGFAFCDGSLLPIAQYDALFNLIGTTYGGDGQTTFAVPDLRGRVPVGAGQGPGLSNYTLGQVSGVETVTLGSSNLANHTHTVTGSASPTDATGGSQPFENRQPTLALTPVIALQGVFPSPNLSSQDFLGSVSWFAGGFAPRGYAIAAGQLLPIAQNQALFSLLGTMYGGNGTTNFALPDLRGRTPISVGGGSSVQLGESGGTENVTPTLANLPSHTHTITGSANPTGVTGGGQAFDNRQPFLGLSFEINMQGAFPSRQLGTGDTSSDPGAVEPIGQGFVSGDVTLDEATARPLIDSLTQEAIRRWQAAGISDVQVAALAATPVVIGDMASGRLASAGESVITIDRDASNHGWFIDVTPGDNLEFGEIDPRTGELVATDSTAGRYYDLLTAIMHEQGHILGLSHTSLPGRIMYGGLGVGARILPAAADLVTDGSTPAAEQFLESMPITASVSMFAGNFAARNWAFTNGQLLPISQNTALFSLLGTTYGGNGTTTFALPDTRGRAIIGAGGQGPGLSPYFLGQTGGQDAVTLTTQQIPAHIHTLPAVSASADLSVTVTDNVTTAAPGSDLTYTIVVSNAGPSDAQTVSLSEATPTGTTFRSISQNGGPAFTFTNPAVGGTGSITGSTATLTAGTSATFTLVVRVNSSAANNTVVSNTASVSSATTDPTPTNSATDTTTIIVLPSLSINEATITEGDSGTVTLSFTVSLSTPAPAGGVTFDIATANNTATAGSDYVATSLTGQTIPAGQLSYTFNVLVIGDTQVEVNETLFVNVTNVVGATVADGQGQGTITDNDTATVSITANSPNAAEPSINGQFTVSLTSPSSTNTVVNYTVSGSATQGSDYTALSGTVTILAGLMSATISVPVIDDRLDEDNETVIVTLTNTNNPAITVSAMSSATVTITDDDPAPTLSIDDRTVDEGAGTVTFTVSLSAASGRTVTVNYATVENTALSNDYTSGSGILTFAPGDTMMEITIGIADDFLDEPDQTFFVNLSSAINATIADDQGQGTITDNDAPPTVTSPTATNIAVTTATLGGNVTSNGSAAITERGIVYAITSLNNNPQLGGAAVTQVTTTGTTGIFTINVSALPAGAQISYAAYATNTVGTSYSSVSTITTFPNVGQLGGVTVQVIGNQLVITGDNRPDRLRLVGTATANEFIVTGLNGTVVNGVANQAITTQGVTNIAWNLTNGADVITMENARVAGNVTIGGGSGFKNIRLGGTGTLQGAVGSVFVGGNLTINGGAGNGNIFVNTTTVVGAMSIVGGRSSGNNQITTAYTSTRGNFSITGGAGYDLVQQTQISVGTQWLINVGAGDDLISIAQCTAFGTATFNSGTGTDNISIAGSQLHAGVRMDGSGGGGSKTLNLYGTFYTGTATLIGGAQDDKLIFDNNTSFINTSASATLNGGGGRDAVLVQYSVLDALFADLGDDSDTLTIRGSRIKGLTSLSGGPGTNVFGNVGNLFEGSIQRSNI